MIYYQFTNQCCRNCWLAHYNNLIKLQRQMTGHNRFSKDLSEFFVGDDDSYCEEEYLRMQDYINEAFSNQAAESENHSELETQEKPFKMENDEISSSQLSEIKPPPLENCIQLQAPSYNNVSLFDERTKKTLDISVDSATIGRYNQVLNQAKVGEDDYSKDTPSYIATRLANKLTSQTKHPIVDQNSKQQIKEFSAEVKKQVSFQTFRKFFGYSEARRDSQNPVMEDSTYDCIRMMSHDYLNSQQFVASLMKGRFKFSNKLFTIKQLDLFGGFPMRPDTCTNNSR